MTESGLRLLHTLNFTEKVETEKLGKGKECVGLRMALVCPLCLWQTSHSKVRVAKLWWHKSQMSAILPVVI